MADQRIDPFQVGRLHWMSRGTTAELRWPAGRVVAGLARHTARLLSHRKRASRTPRPPGDLWLERVEDALNGIFGSIQQVSIRTARRLVIIAIGKLGGVAAIGGISGLVALGHASTGPLIASLSGAAAVSAKLYWIGSLFGLGAVAGGAILGAAGLGAGAMAAFWVRRHIFGRTRRDADVEEHEKRILASCLTLLKAIAEQRACGETVTDQEAMALAEIALFPIVAEVEAHWDRVSMAKAGIKSAYPFTTTLKPVYRYALRRYAGRLEKLSAETLK